MALLSQHILEVEREAGAAVRAANAQLTGAADSDLQLKLEARSTMLAGLLAKAVRELEAIWHRRGAPPAWFPPHDLVLLTKLDLNRQQLGVTSCATTTRRPGEHGPTLTSRRTLAAVRRALLDAALAGNPIACAIIMRLAAKQAGHRRPANCEDCGDGRRA